MVALARHDREGSASPIPLESFQDSHNHRNPAKMDRQSVYTLSLFGEDKAIEESNKRVQKELVDFILDFHLDNVFIYRYETNKRVSGHDVNVIVETKYERMCCRGSTFATWTLHTSSLSTSTWRIG